MGEDFAELLGGFSGALTGEQELPEAAAGFGARRAEWGGGELRLGRGKFPQLVGAGGGGLTRRGGGPRDGGKGGPPRRGQARGRLLLPGGEARTRWCR